MARTLDTGAYLDSVCQLLQQGQTQVPVPVTGSSMTPFLHSGDTVYLNPPSGAPKRGQIVLYTRPGGDYVLHRIFRVQADGTRLLVGDAQQALEYLPASAPIHGVVVCAKHGKALLTPRSFRWWFYRHVWLWLRPFRHRLMALKRKLKR